MMRNPEETIGKLMDKQGVSLITDLIQNVNKIHTTPLGVLRIKKNLCLDTDDVVNWCVEKIRNPKSRITRKGKNWYLNVDDCMITVNVYSYTIITAHKIKKSVTGRKPAPEGNGQKFEHDNN
ncbi:MAG: DUF3781 domain-containing protein [Tannerellaceae bacterium]|jgi:hypothetical protein|nr:DUF3781 domain-containing protein [Tannerellaceae bacterium]